MTSIVNAKDLGHVNQEGLMKNKLDKWKLLEVKPKNSEEIWFFRKNLGVDSVKSNKSFQTLVYFTVKFKPKDSLGLPNEQDTKTLYNFEEDIIPIVEKDAKCVHVASVVKSGIKDHLFYVSDADLFLKTISVYQDRLKEFAVSIEQQNDPKWEVYDDFP
jgi:hypothetical protein